MSIVIDASAILAVIRGEAGADMVMVHSKRGLLGAVNLAEVLSKANDLAIDPVAVRKQLARLELMVEPFTDAQAAISGALRGRTRHAGLSLGDRACVALAIDHGLPILTGDRRWVDADLDLGVEIRLIR